VKNLHLLRALQYVRHSSVPLIGAAR
jgi:hypothetical protein